MTLLQLRVALATAEQKSISGAAKFLNTSQPNASNSLKLLEDEIGFPIMMRTSGGVTVTPKGARFLEYARDIVDANEKVQELKESQEVYRLRLGTINYYTAAEPFFTLCARHRDDAKTDLRYLSVSISEGIQALVRRELDIIAVPAMQHQLSGLVSECKKNGIVMIPICRIPAVVILRSGHPAVLDGRCRNISQGSDALKDYPYIGLRNLSEDLSSTGYNDSDFVQCSYKIFVDDTNVRLRMTEITNGFYFGLPSSYRQRGNLDLTFLPVEGVNIEMFCLIARGDESRLETNEYIELLKQELDQLIKTTLQK